MSRRTIITRTATGPNVVALGGGHGLAATLRALRRVTDQITAVVGVADDGGSSGRLREEFGVLPPGDLRMALAALCGDDTWGRTWSDVIQHRFGGDGDLGGHSIGNMLITALWEETHDIVIGLDWLGALLEAQGRVLPCSTVPLEIVADVSGLDQAHPEHIAIVRGQVAVATTEGTVERIGLEPANPPACAEAVAAIMAADVVVLGPGSWFTSVLPHLLIPELAEAIVASKARKVLVMNLDPQRDQETAGVPVCAQLEMLSVLEPRLILNAVIVDPRHVGEAEGLHEACGTAQLHLAGVGHTHPSRAGTHDPDRLAVAFGTVFESFA